MDRRFLTASLLALLVALPASPRVEGNAPQDPAYIAAHDAALRRARVWFPPKTPIPRANLGRNDSAPDGFREDAVVTCKFKIEAVSGVTPKFVCERNDGDDFKVKYGAKNPEIYAEVLGTRLLNALGFPADRMYRVARVRCYGCSDNPFEDLQCLNAPDTSGRCLQKVDYTRYQDFDHAVIERSVKGRRIETEREEGWSWDELSKIDPAAGGSSRAEVDALRLLAVFLAHWDNKAKNQRLLCLDQAPARAAARTPTCSRPVAMIHDLGGTFGPSKLNLREWADSPVWANRTGCLVSMRDLPRDGWTFADAQISEDGRAFLAKLLGQLSVEQIRALFHGAGVADYPRASIEARNVDNWVKAFQAKVEAVANRPACG